MLNIIVVLVLSASVVTFGVVISVVKEARVELMLGTVNFVEAFKLLAFTIRPFKVVELTVVNLPVGALNSVRTLKLVQDIFVLQLMSDVLISIPVTIFAFIRVDDIFVKLQLIEDRLDIFIVEVVDITSPTI